ncbi:C39 family peptidase [Candidatus Babeliales bacterium]|nr:C39 family peptidase [Candidatus Babeliales bacterium]
MEVTRYWKQQLLCTILFSLVSLTNIYAFSPKRRLRHTKNSLQNNPVSFSGTLSKFMSLSDYETPDNTIIWEETTPKKFNELIVSWNAKRPQKGQITFWVSTKHTQWSPWHRLAEWGPDYQLTFVNKLNQYVHTTHVRSEMQQGRLAQGFRVKAVFQNGAAKKNLHALFACFSNLSDFRTVQKPFTKPSVLIPSVPRQSQMNLSHNRARDLCSPTSLSMIVRYLATKFSRPQARSLHDDAITLAEKVHDNGYLNIYGNWVLNVAQAYDSCQHAFYRVERMNSFDTLYQYLNKKIPVAVSVRRLKGGATPYANGHFLVIVGWDRAKQSVLCIDPAFDDYHTTFKSYPLKNFLKSWGLSKNLAYVPLLKSVFNEQKK